LNSPEGCSLKKKRFIILAMLIAAVVAAALVILVFLNRDDQPNRYVWFAQTNAKGDNLLVRGDRIDRIKGDLPALIDTFNRSVQSAELARLPQDGGRPVLPKLRFKDVRKRVLALDVQNDEYLTERMGSTGAQEYLAAATFTLTEYEKIDAVRFDFREGDHAAPGTYTRDDFLKRWKIIR